jgi:hypothetical protein
VLKKVLKKKGGSCCCAFRLNSLNYFTLWDGCRAGIKEVHPESWKQTFGVHFEVRQILFAVAADNHSGNDDPDGQHENTEKPYRHPAHGKDQS